MSETQDTSDDLQLTDPDDYHRKERLKEIHQARQRVHTVLDSFDDPPKRGEAGQRTRRLNNAISMYVAELEPLIQDADADAEIGFGEQWPFDSLMDYADHLGRPPSDYRHPDTGEHLNYMPRENAIEVFRRCNRILADVKPLIEEGDTDAEFGYSELMGETE